MRRAVKHAVRLSFCAPPPRRGHRQACAGCVELVLGEREKLPLKDGVGVLRRCLSVLEQQLEEDGAKNRADLQAQ